MRVTPTVTKRKAFAKPPAATTRSHSFRVLGPEGAKKPVPPGQGIPAKLPGRIPDPLSTGIKEIDLTLADIAESRRRIEQYRQQAADEQEFINAALAELALKIGVRLEPGEIVRPEVLAQLPVKVRRVVEAFCTSMDERVESEVFRTTRPMGRNVGKMI